MATSGSFNTETKTWSGDGYTIKTYFTFSWSLVSQSVENCTSTIYWTVTTVQTPTGSGYTRGVRGQSYTVVNGNTYTIPGSWSSAYYNVYNGFQTQSGTTIIPHDATTGKKSFSASVNYGVGYGGVNCSGSGSWALPDIPRNPMVWVYKDITTGWVKGKPYVYTGTNLGWQQAIGKTTFDEVSVEGVVVWDGTTWKTTVTKG